MTDFGHGGQSQQRLAICADNIVHKCVRSHRVQSMLLYSHNQIGRQSDATGERSGA